jgi:hypothetical protein
VVHGDADRYFPVGHAEALYAAAKEPRELWVEPGFGHAEAAAAREEAGREMVGRIGQWVRALPAAGSVGDAERVRDEESSGSSRITGPRDAGDPEPRGYKGRNGELGESGEVMEDEAG